MKTTEELVRIYFCKGCDKMNPIPKADCWYDNCLLQNYEAVARAARRFVKAEAREKAKQHRQRVRKMLKERAEPVVNELPPNFGRIK